MFLPEQTVWFSSSRVRDFSTISIKDSSSSTLFFFDCLSTIAQSYSLRLFDYISSIFKVNFLLKLINIPTGFMVCWYTCAWEFAFVVCIGCWWTEIPRNERWTLNVPVTHNIFTHTHLDGEANRWPNFKEQIPRRKEDLWSNGEKLFFRRGIECSVMPIFVHHSFYIQSTRESDGETIDQEDIESFLFRAIKVSDALGASEAYNWTIGTTKDGIKVSYLPPDENGDIQLSMHGTSWLVTRVWNCNPL